MGAIVLELESSGDFGGIFENAVVNVEGLVAGSAGEFGEDCIPWNQPFLITAAELESIRVDGQMQVDVNNNAAVEPRCPSNHHTVRLRTFPAL